MSLNKFGLDSLSQYFHVYFGKRGVVFCRSLSAITIAMMHSCSVSTGAIATSMSAISGKSFSCCDKHIRYFLSNVKFQVDDQLWRCYLKYIFSFLKEGGYIDKSRKIYIQVDYTSVSNHFLILYASIAFRNKAVPIYFSMRRYPKSKNIFNQIKTEQAFVKGLKHCLSSKYQYVIAADRGFGNSRFITLCEQNNFEYIVRIKSDLNINHRSKTNLKSLTNNKSLKDIYVNAWAKKTNIFIRKKNESIWYICSNISILDRKRIIKEYERRFKIEKCFFDQKSNGFDIEKSKIRKYENLKRLIFTMLVSQSMLMFTGDILKHNNHNIKKDFPQSVSLILAFSSLLKDT